MGWTSSQTQENNTLHPVPSYLALIPLPPSISWSFCSFFFALHPLLLQGGWQESRSWADTKRGHSSQVAQPFPAGSTNLTQVWMFGRATGISSLSARASSSQKSVSVCRKFDLRSLRFLSCFSCAGCWLASKTVHQRGIFFLSIYSPGIEFLMAFPRSERYNPSWTDIKRMPVWFRLIKSIIELMRLRLTCFPAGNGAPG